MIRFRSRLLLLIGFISSANCLTANRSVSWLPFQYVQQANRRFEQKTDRFYEYDEQSRKWTETELPCSKLGFSIQRGTGSRGEGREGKIDGIKALPQRKRMSLRKMSETSVWVTGESGSIYERFWNGVQWVVAPNDLPVSAGRAVSVFFVNQTILALSEVGLLYQMHLIGESSQPSWVDFPTLIDLSSFNGKDQSAAIQIKSGVVSHNGEKVYFCTKKGLLLELSEVEPPRWANHGRPPGGNIAEIVDAAANLRPEVIFTISTTGELYEFDRSSRPSWKKHVRGEDTSLILSKGCTLPGLNRENSISIFLLTKGGKLIERRLHQRKWKWIEHESPEEHNLSSITLVRPDESVEDSYGLFFTTTTGHVLEYRNLKHSDTSDNLPDNWVNHFHPEHARVARGISGSQLHLGRILFPLDDGRLGDLHLSSLGGENSGPSQVNSIRKKQSGPHVWSILDAPETEGWNAPYCTEERGPTNCINGIKDDNNMDESGITRTVIRKRKSSQTRQEYLIPSTPGSDGEDYGLPDDRTASTNFRLRVMFEGKSFFLITDSGVVFEYLYGENMWLWLRHDHSTDVKGAVGNYNGSLFVVDVNGSLFMRERAGDSLRWVNCTAMRKGKKVIGGPPWDGIPGRDAVLTVEDSIFLVGNSGRLLQFTVSQKRFKWKDCRNPTSTKIASIVDQEQFRRNIVFVVGTNGRLYQYNRVTELWHEHSQSHHLVLSVQPGTAIRPSAESLSGSVFMISKDGGLVEYKWSAAEGWDWVEHGAPNKGVSLVGSPGPCFLDGELFLIGSDGMVCLRYMDRSMWKWMNLGYPEDDFDVTEDQICGSGICDPKVSMTRPIPFSEDSVIFELRDGRLAEMRKTEHGRWVWSRTIGTPTSPCRESFWAALQT